MIQTEIIMIIVCCRLLLKVSLSD
uniref:Uncharacterized protein n=1 Tax=Anguilla anguilla TaxID=7936 RepID=A0A0E9QLJ6_ANGAN